MNHIERVLAVVENRRPDQTPVSFRHHFPEGQVFGQAAVDAHMARVTSFDLDFLKIMNDNDYPHDGPIETVDDLGSLKELRGREEGFERQLDLIAALKKEIAGSMLMTTTVFNAYSTLRKLVREPKKGHNPPNMDAAGDAGTATILGFFEEDPDAVHKALRTIAANLSRFVRRCIDAGADGVYMSVRDDWLTSAGVEGASYDELVGTSDLGILYAADEGRFNMLHVCGKAADFEAFAKYPVHVINWADRAAGPAIRDVRDRVKPAICTGVDNLSTLPDGTPEDCAAEVADALSQAGDRPIMIAPGCTFDPEKVPPANLEAMCAAVRGA